MYTDEHFPISIVIKRYISSMSEINYLIRVRNVQVSQRNKVTI